MNLTNALSAEDNALLQQEWSFIGFSASGGRKNIVRGNKPSSNCVKNLTFEDTKSKKFIVTGDVVTYLCKNGAAKQINETLRVADIVSGKRARMKTGEHSYKDGVYNKGNGMFYAATAGGLHLKPFTGSGKYSVKRGSYPHILLNEPENGYNFKKDKTQPMINSGEVLSGKIKVVNLIGLSHIPYDDIWIELQNGKNIPLANLTSL